MARPPPLGAPSAPPQEAGLGHDLKERERELILATLRITGGSRKLAAERGRNPGRLQINGFIGPAEDGVSLDDLKFYKEAGVHRVILFSQRDAVRMAAGRTLEIVRKLAPTVERAQHA